jgi:DNA-binding beta-propeller fold protein YncE
MTTLHSLKKTGTFFTRILAITIFGVSALAIVIPVATSSRSARAVTPPTYAYLSGEAGHYNYVIDDATKTLSATVGPFNANNNWRCNRMTNVANNAGTKVIQASACQANGVIINVADNTFSNLSFGSSVMAFSTDDQYVYSMGYTRQKTRISDGTNVWQVGNGGGSYGSQIAITTSLDGSKLYVPFQQNPTWKVDVLNTVDGSTVKSISDPAWSWPSWTVRAPVGQKVYVGLSNAIGVIDTATDTIVSTLPVSWNSAASVSPDGNFLYVSSGSNVLKLNATTGAQLDSWSVSTGEGGVAVNPSGTYVYALNNNGVGLSIINISTGAISDVSLGSERSRTIVFAQPVQSPDISLSRSTGTANVDSAVSGLYSISNSGDAASSYSISPSLPTGLSFSTSTGLISGTPTSVSSRASYTITARNAAGTSAKVFSLAVELASGLTPTFSAVVTGAVGFTFSITNSSVNYAYSGTATNGGSVAISGSSVTVTGLAAGASSTVTITATRNGYADATAAISGSATSPTTTTVAQGQSSVATIAPSNGPTTTVLNPMRPQVPQSTTTSTTIPADAAPKAPALAPGEAGAVVDGKTIAATLSRADNQITAAAGNIKTTVSGLTPDGQRVALNAEGNLVVNEGDKLVVSATGFSPGADVSVWLYSSPTRLGVVAADVEGKVSGSFDLPSGLEVGDHRLVLSGENQDGVNALLGLGLSYGAVDSGSSITRVLIAIPIALAVLFGLFLPAVTRRRKKNAIA